MVEEVNPVKFWKVDRRVSSGRCFETLYYDPWYPDDFKPPVESDGPLTLDEKSARKILQLTPSQTDVENPEAKTPSGTSPT